MGTSTSSTGQIDAPILEGIWVHAVTDPGGTERNFRYNDSARGETIDLDETLLSFIGRTFPVMEYGTAETQTIDVSIIIPFEDSHDASVESLRAFKRSRATLCYRDNRSRLVFGVFSGSLTFSDERAGTTAGATFQRTDYTEGS